MNQIDTEWRVLYRPKGHAGAPLEKLLKHQSELQMEIDRIRQVEGEILEVGAKRASLEEIFVRMAFDKKEA